MASDADAENARPRKRTTSWPSHDAMHTIQIESDEDPGINFLSFSSDGQRLAVICNDRTIRIWNIASRVETARLGQNAQIMAVAWMSDDMGVISLGQDGVISKWTRTVRLWFWSCTYKCLMDVPLDIESEPLAVGKAVGRWEGGFNLFCI